MKKLLALLAFVCISEPLFSQSYSVNLQKYWWYRYRLVNDYMKVGLDFGESIPIEKRHFSGEGLVGPGHIHSGDGTQHLGNYMVLLATEYAMLQNNGLSTARTRYELYCAIKALDRLDLYTEAHCRDFALTENNTNLVSITSGSLPYNNDFNGFFTRDDLHRSFIAFDVNDKGYIHFNRPGVCVDHIVRDVFSDLALRTDGVLSPPWSVVHPTLPRYPPEESQDQYAEIYKGLALIVALVPSSATYNGQIIRDLAKEALLRASMYINSVHGEWKIRNPLTQLCIYGVEPDHGPDCTLLAPPGANASGLAGGIGIGF